MEGAHRPNKIVVFHLAAGEGVRPIQGNIAEKPYSEAHALWVATRMGTVGHHFEWTGTDARVRKYRVTDKREEQDAIVVTCDVYDVHGEN